MPGAALALSLPSNALLTAEINAPLTSIALPIGPYADQGIETLAVEGAVNHSAWRIRGAGAITTLQILAPLRDQLRAEGFDVVFQCASRSCGGFDFRYETQVLPEPDMHVDLGDFRYMLAEKPAAGDAVPEYAVLLVSRSSDSGFVQLTRVGPTDAEPLEVALSTKAMTRPDAPADAVTSQLPGPQTLTQTLVQTGAAALDDLTFDTGSSALGAGDFASLAELSAYLLANPAHRVTLVGHTDTDGSLAGNVALSKRRAQSVANRLRDRFGVPAAQISADGVGFLAPRASNLDPDGRTQNRRVEVILTATD